MGEGGEGWEGVFAVFVASGDDGGDFLE